MTIAWSIVPGGPSISTTLTPPVGAVHAKGVSYPTLTAPSVGAFKVGTSGSTSWTPMLEVVSPARTA